MISLKKRGAVYGVIGLMLCVAVYLNWSYFQSPTELTVASQSDEETAETSENVYGEVTSVNADSGSAESGEDQTTETSAQNDYFSQARLSRQTARDQALSILKDTLSAEDTTEAAKEEATGQISTIAANSVKESKIESLIKAKGYADAVVYLEDGSVNAIVAPPSGGLTETDTAKIADIIVSEANVDLSAVKISEASDNNS